MATKAVVNPAGRLDLLLVRLAEQGTRMIERHTGIAIWDGENGLGGVVEQKVKELKIPETSVLPGSALNVRSLAEQAGFIRRRRARKAVR